MITRSLRPEQAQDLLPLINEFMAESQWAWTYNPRNSLGTILNYTTNPETDIIIVKTGDHVLCGFAMLAWEKDFSDERIGYVSKFYISEKFRKTKAGRMLAQACCAWFDYNNCKASFATSTANIGEHNAFNNLMAKYGFKPCGDTLARSK